MDYDWYVIIHTFHRLSQYSLERKTYYWNVKQFLLITGIFVHYQLKYETYGCLIVLRDKIMMDNGHQYQKYLKTAPNDDIMH